MDPAALGVYATVCGWTLARAHARSGDAVAIASYLGHEATASTVRWPGSPRRYADQNERDYEELTNAVRDGLIKAETEV